MDEAQPGAARAESERSMIPAPHGSGGRLLPLDGVRLIAFLLVLCFHSRALPFGWVGVHLFFVLSGFLITRALVASRERSPAGQYFRNFYGRRFLRLSPPYFSYLAVILVITLVRPSPTVSPWLPWCAVYLANYFFAAHPRLDNPFVTHFWSLAVEEQFYLAWPVLLWVTRRVRISRILWAAVILGPVIRLAVGLIASRSGLSQDDVHRLTYVSPTSYIDAFAVGALMNWARVPRVRLAALVAGIVAVAAGLVVVLLTAAPPSSLGYELWLPHGYMWVWGYSLLSVALALFIGAVNSGLWRRVLEHPTVRYLGRLTYGLYIWHFAVISPVTKVLRHLALPAPLAHWLVVLVTFAITVPIAALSFHTIERWSERLKARWFPLAPRPVG